MASSPIRVLLVEDNRGVRLALRTLLRTAADIAVVGEAATVADAIVEAKDVRPDVIVLDLRLPDGSGAKAARAIRRQRPEVRVLLLSSASDDEALAGGVISGASAVVKKQLRGTDLVGTVRQVAQGKMSLDDQARARALAVLETRLWPARMPVLTLVAAGKSDQEIASTLQEDAAAVGREVDAMADAISCSVGRTL